LANPILIGQKRELACEADSFRQTHEAGLMMATEGMLSGPEGERDLATGGDKKPALNTRKTELHYIQGGCGAIDPPIDSHSLRRDF
jgi:hypothetical protein